MSDYTAIIKSPLGYLGIISTETSLVAIHFLEQAKPFCATNNRAAKAVTDLETYFINPREFINQHYLSEIGTDFQQRVWAATNKIPVGSYLSYGDLAKQLDSAPRPVGQALKRNPLPILVPCHRVVGKKTLGGYLGQTEAKMENIKTWLLNHESVC